MTEENKETKTCPECQSEISTAAKKCPNCQSDLRNWFMRHKVITGILAIILIFGLIGAMGGGTTDTDNTTSPTNTESQQEPTQVEAMEADTASFVGEFDTNQLAAEDKYSGKLIEFTGFVGNISEDITGTAYVIINPTNEEFYAGTSIQCFFEDRGNLTSLENGQQTTLRGTVDTQVGNVLVEECEIVQ